MMARGIFSLYALGNIAQGDDLPDRVSIAVP